MTQNLYLDRQVDVELSDGDNNGWKKPSGDDTKGGGASSVEQIAPKLISSSVLEQVHTSVVDQVDTTIPSASGQTRKRAPLSLKCKQSKPPANQVMTQIELPPYHGLLWI
jgi:hypothetical protein